MDILIRILREFPAIWLSIGAAVSAMVAYVVAKRFTPVYASTVHDLNQMHKDMVEGYQMQISELKRERNDYRDKLHTEKSEHQATMLRLAEVEARPNVENVYKGQQAFFQRMSEHMDEQTKTMKAIHLSLEHHDKGIEARTARVVEQMLIGLEAKKLLSK